MHEQSSIKNVKAEVLDVKFHSRHEKISFLSAVIRTTGSLIVRKNELKLVIATENAMVKDKLNRITKEIYKEESNAEGSFRQELEYKGEFLLQMLHDCAVIDFVEGKAVTNAHIDSRIIKSEACAVAFIRGAFLGGGSLAVGAKYHMEFLFNHPVAAEDFCNILSRFDIFPKTVGRKEKMVVYLKDSQAISDCLALIGAAKAVLELNNLIAERQVASYSNRFTNCEIYNLGKQVDASVRQTRAGTYLLEKELLSDPKLIETARARIANPDSSYEQLAALLGVSKSGVKHRLIKLCELYEAYQT